LRKTKIICTLGPAVDSTEAIASLLRRGMNGARFNFSHGTHESHAATLAHLEQAMAETGLTAAKILDTKGPEIRIRTFENHAIRLEAGAEFILSATDAPGNQARVSVTYENLPQEVAPGTRILLDDGLIRLDVLRIEGADIVCTVVTGGRLSGNKSINIPGSHIRLPALTEKDRQDLAFAVAHEFDYIAASFIRSAADVAELRAALDALGGERIRIISKIENQQGVDNMAEIVEASDGVMVARGDLGVEIPAERVPIVQKQMISACRSVGKLVIVATQMLDSMIHNPAPTRAEVSDVANAVFEMASCVMLSGETASGDYPMESLDTMRTVVEETERSIDYWSNFTLSHSALHSSNPVSDAVTHTCCVAAMDLGAKAIVTATTLGHSARMVGRFRPGCDILALTPEERTARQLALMWGVHPRRCPQVDSTDAMFALCAKAAAETEGIEQGDMVVLVAGVPIGVSGSTNLIKAQRIE